MTEERVFEIEVAPEAAGSRLDVLLARSVPELSRARIQALVRGGHVRVDDVPVDDPSRKVRAGERLRLSVPPPEPAEPHPEDLPLSMLYEDEHLLVLEKPAGMVVHPAPGHAGGTLVNALLAHCGESLSGIGGVARPGIVHRLDRDVSGVMVVAKHDRAHVGLAGQFTVHSVERVYEAILHGVPTPASGTVDRPIGRHPIDRKRMAVVEGGKRAVTHYRVLEAAGMLAARVELRLETGRTHQIRVHMQALGHPLLGDPVYRPRRERLPREVQAWLSGLGRILLHARVLGFTHPVTGERLRFETPPPACFDEAMARLRAAARAA
ncbi:Ribosomal large subunit pseudouridine synthase D [bacterium HR39]|nr:Ribosomal large subunit pseudouridine synthase D [bacterium HR39]